MTLYYVIYPAAETAPTDVQIVSGLAWAPAVAAANAAIRETTGDQTFAEVTGLTAGNYRVACVVYDGVAYSNVSVSDSIAISDAITLDVGSFTLTGGDVTFAASLVFPIDAGSFALTGGDVTFIKGVVTELDAGSFDVLGGDLAFSASRALALAQGTFTLTGGDVTFAASLGFAADAGSFTLTGGDVTFSADSVTELGSGVFTLTGGAITFSLSDPPRALKINGVSVLTNVNGTLI